MNSDNQIILLEGLLSRLDEIIEEMEDDQELFYSTVEHAVLLRDLVQDILDSIL